MMKRVELNFLNRMVFVLWFLFVLSVASCRGSLPPKIPVCIGDGAGGADCVNEVGEEYYCDAQCLENYWMTTQDGMEKFSNWCYEIPRYTSKEKEKLGERNPEWITSHEIQKLYFGRIFK